MLDDRAARDIETLRRIVGGDKERDRAEPFLQILGTIRGIELDQQRRRDASPGNCG